MAHHTRLDRIHLDAGDELVHGCDAAVLDTARHDAGEVVEVHGYVQGEPVHRNAPRHTHADGRDLFVTDPDTAVFALAARVDAEIGQRRLDRSLQHVHMPEHPTAQGLEINDRISHELTGSMIGDIAATSDPDHIDALPGERFLRE